MSTEVRTETAAAPVTAAAPAANDTPAPVASVTTQQTAGASATQRQKRMLGWGLLILAFLLAYLFLVFWPEGVTKNASGILVDPNGNPVTGSTRQTIHLVGNLIRFQISVDVRFILMVMMAGGLGSFIHTATSFGDYVGNEKLTTNWLWWYVQRPFIGMMLAVVFYLVIRGGFLSGGGDAGSVNPFGIAALAGLVGMFSKQATDKLSEVFDTLFRTSPGAGDSKRKDDLRNPVPVLTDVEPRNVRLKSANVVVTVKGSGFVRGASVRVRDSSRETDFADATRLTAKLLPEDVANEGEMEVTVFNPGPGGGTSTPIRVRIDPGDKDGGGGRPTPTVTSAPGGNGSVPPTKTVDASAPTEDADLPVVDVVDVPAGDDAAGATNGDAEDTGDDGEVVVDNPDEESKPEDGGAG